MTPGLRKFALTAHVTSSVGWLGAVAGFLVLSIAGMTSQDAEVVRGAYFAMNLIGGFIIVPLSLAALLTGLIQSLGTQWGLFRHYWVVVKFAITILATILLLLHQFTAVAGAARRVSGTAAGTMPEVGRLGAQLVSDAGLAVLVLLAATTLSVYKPWGQTRHGQRKRLELRRWPPGSPQTVRVTPMFDPERETANIYTRTTGGGPRLGPRIGLAVISVVVALFILLHLTGVIGGHGH